VVGEKSYLNLRANCGKKSRPTLGRTGLLGITKGRDSRRKVNTKKKAGKLENRKPSSHYNQRVRGDPLK